MTSTIAYHGYSIFTVKAADGRWTAQIRRLDGQPITNILTGVVKSIFETDFSPQEIEDRAVMLAKQTIDGGGLQ